MRCGHLIESCGSEWFQSALTATISTTLVSHFVGSVHTANNRLLPFSINHLGQGCSKNSCPLCPTPCSAFGGYRASCTVPIDEHWPTIGTNQKGSPFRFNGRQSKLFRVSGDCIVTPLFFLLLFTGCSLIPLGN